MFLQGRLTNVSTYTPPISPENPTPRTFTSLEIEGVKVSLPAGFPLTSIPVIGSDVNVDVVGKYGQRGLTLAVVNSPTAITPIT